VEFALVAPAFIGMICGIMEYSCILFVQTLLEGGAREAARFGVTGQEIDQDGAREARIRAIINEFTLSMIDVDHIDIDTLVYDSFEAIGEPEPYEDSNGNGAYDSGEPFEDINGNGVWDPDMGTVGLGGPGDIVLYRLTYDWPIIIPIFEPFFGEKVTLVANIAVRNEPWPE
ncbi:MAG TPA: TadE/TadG family type IV pilus assembly protein, partial [Geminicoccaceae bacterium]|nr:TadE/TadG family type IV pilus assembly protein [Geminicoccaceae bacterium]